MQPPVGGGDEAQVALDDDCIRVFEGGYPRPVPAGVRLDEDDLAAVAHPLFALAGQGRCKPDVQAAAGPVEDVSQAPLRFDELRRGRGVSLFEDEANDPERHAFGKAEDLGAMLPPVTVLL